MITGVLFDVLDTVWLAVQRLKSAFSTLSSNNALRCSDLNNNFRGTRMQHSGMAPITVSTGFFLVAFFGLVPPVKQEKQSLCFIRRSRYSASDTLARLGHSARVWPALQKRQFFWEGLTELNDQTGKYHQYKCLTLPCQGSCLRYYTNLLAASEEASRWSNDTIRA